MMDEERKTDSLSDPDLGAALGRLPLQKEKVMSDVTPRRCRVDLYVPAETAIRAAKLAVEEMPSDERLTAAVILLGQAQDKVADFIDGVAASPEGPTAPPKEAATKEAATNEPIYVGTRADWKWRAEQAEQALGRLQLDLEKERKDVDYFARIAARHGEYLIQVRELLPHGVSLSYDEVPKAVKEQLGKLEADVARLRHLAHQLVEQWQTYQALAEATETVFSKTEASTYAKCIRELLAALTEPPA